MKSLFKKVVKPFLPSYEVVCTNYQVVPGLPISKNQSKHSFAKGDSRKAMQFYGKVISSDLTKIMAPVEVHLKKRGRIIKHTQFGPVEEFKNIKIASRN